MTKLEKAKQIIKENLEEATCGIFDSKNIIGDHMVNIYSSEELIIDICYSWGYFEIFGLSRLEFENLESYYDQLVEAYHRRA